MKLIFLSFTILCFSLKTYSQINIPWDSIQNQDGILVTKNNSKKKNGIICKIYSLDKKLKYSINFITKEKKIDPNNLNYLIDNNILLLDGDYVSYYDNGDTLQYTQFKENNRVGKQVKFEIGNLKIEELNILTPQKAHFCTFYKNGNIQMEFDLLNDKKEGVEKHFYNNGILKAHMLFKNNRIDGKLIEYNLQGNIIRESIIKNDKIVQDSGSIQPIIDSLKFTTIISERISDLKKNSIISQYINEHNITFNFDILSNGIISNIDLMDLPDSIQRIIKVWLTDEPIIKPEKFLNEPVKANVEFRLNWNDSCYFLRRSEYKANINNHFYYPHYTLESLPLALPETEDNPFIMVEDMPVFNGGDPQMTFREYIGKNLRYPEEAQEKGIQGKVYVQFVVDMDGSVKSVRILRSVHPSLDAEAIRVVSRSPRWRPGYQRRKVVKVLFTFPVNFVIK